MRNPISAKSFVFVRIAAAVVLTLSELTIAGWFTFGRAGQDLAKPGARQEQEKPGKRKQTGRKPKEEEEETTKPPRKVPLRVGDEDLEASQPPSAAKPGTVHLADLEREAERARHPAVRELFTRLAKPHDVVTMTNLRTWTVEPIPEYIGPKPKSLSLRLLDDATWKHVRSFTVRGDEIRGVEPYEQLALSKVDEFLKSGLDRDSASKQYLPRLEMLQEAEKALGAVLLFHDSAVERGLRKGNAWNELRTRLVARLKEVQLDQLGALTDLKNWEAALELGTRISEAYPSRNVQLQIVGLLAKSARESLKEEKYDLTYKRLNVLEEQFPNSPVLKPIREGLEQAARGFVKEAEALEKQGEIAAASKRLDTAKQIYPQLPGLHDLELRLGKKNPVLYVGVHDLPEYLSPATAYLDSEKQAVELLFESLVKLTYSSKMGPCYQPVLAGDLPRMVPLGRQFTLTRGACWSNEHLVTAPDVRHTVELLSDRSWSGHIPEWAELLKDGARIGVDNLHISLTLHQGYVDPLSLMDFKVLPQYVNHADDLSFAKAPVGSGPYKLLPKKEPGSVVFVANPYYETRPGKSGLPRIREIHFVRSEHPANDFQDGRLQLLLDLPTSRYKELDSTGLRDVVTFKTLPNRRIYFLAVNHRRSPLDNKALRRALAHAINREAILNKCFREGLTPRPHLALNGPYPPRSWAYNRSSRLPPDPFNLDLAKAQARLATDGRAVPCRLYLKYPKGDAAVAEACKQIQQQVQLLGAGINLELMSLEPRDLRRDVEEYHDYDLAYYSWDYPDETYWLWPLFDPRATQPGGRNFLGYQDDEDLESYFRRAMSHRDPAQVKNLTHSIHEVFYEKMPFIPLWQLDTHLAVHKNLSMVDSQGRPVDPDPLLIFTNVETWTLDKR